MYRLTCGQMRKKLLEDAKLEKTLSAFESNTTQTSDSVLQCGSSKEFLGPNDDKSSEEEWVLVNWINSLAIILCVNPFCCLIFFPFVFRVIESSQPPCSSSSVLPGSSSASTSASRSTTSADPSTTSADPSTTHQNRVETRWDFDNSCFSPPLLPQTADVQLQGCLLKKSYKCNNLTIIFLKL